ncbi:hypothetical protein C8J57DRAFT_1244074 [Mycena rebaudengoi]|nr:hypothetical protein C8J57DRAFT_1244074 [Mycena rebaudengoi]
MSTASTSPSEKTTHKTALAATRKDDTKTKGVDTGRTTRASTEPRKMADILLKTREELYQATEYLQQKGYLELGPHTAISVAKTALVLLRIAASGGGATASDGIRAVALLVERRRIDRLLEDLREDVATLAETVAEEAAWARGRGQREDDAAHTLLEAAEVLTRTVDEQVEVSRGVVGDLEAAAVRASDAADELRTERGVERGEGPRDHASPGGGSAPPGRDYESPNRAAEGVVPRSYATAVGARGQPPTRECAAALAKAAQREVEIVITRAPEVTTHGLAQLTERELVAKARIAMVKRRKGRFLLGRDRYVAGTWC